MEHTNQCIVSCKHIFIPTQIWRRREPTSETRNLPFPEQSTIGGVAGVLESNGCQRETGDVDPLTDAHVPKTYVKKSK